MKILYIQNGYVADDDINSEGELAAVIEFVPAVEITTAGTLSKSSAFVLALTTLILALVWEKSIF